MCWQQHLPGNLLEKNGHKDNKISRADFQEAGVEDWCLCRLPICTTSPVLLILKTLSLSGNYLLWLYSGLPDPISTWPKAIPYTAGSPLNNTQFLFRVLKNSLLLFAKGYLDFYWLTVVDYYVTCSVKMHKPWITSVSEIKRKGQGLQRSLRDLNPKNRALNIFIPFKEMEFPSVNVSRCLHFWCWKYGFFQNLDSRSVSTTSQSS